MKGVQQSLSLVWIYLLTQVSWEKLKVSFKDHLKEKKEHSNFVFAFASKKEEFDTMVREAMAKSKKEYDDYIAKKMAKKEAKKLAKKD